MSGGDEVSGENGDTGREVAAGLAEYVERWRAGKLELAPISGLLGIRPVAIEDGKASVEMEADERFHNAMGTLHGGVLLDLADVAMGVAMATRVEPKETFSTIHSGIAYLRPVTADRLTAHASVAHRGRTTAHLDCEIEDSEGRTVARVTSVCAIRPSKQA